MTGASSLPYHRPVALPIAALAQAVAEEEVPQYHMSRTIQTIPELWQEWTVGLHGQLSIERLDELYGARWRSGPAGAQSASSILGGRLLSLRFGAWQLAVRDPPDEEAYNRVVLQLEDERRRARASLSRVIDTLKGAR